MNPSTALAVAAALGLTLLSGAGDSYGFVHAARIWDDGRLVAGELARWTIQNQVTAVLVVPGIGRLLVTTEP